MHILGWILFGLIAGAIARALMPGRQPMGIIMTIILGIIGSFVGGAVANALQGGSLTDPVPAGWIGSILGAILVLFIYGMVVGRRTTV